MTHSCAPQQGLTLPELLIAVALSSLLMAAMQGLLSNTLQVDVYAREREEALTQANIALQQMQTAIRRSARLFIPHAENPATAHSESVRDVLAVSMDPELDRDRDGWADANNDKDFLDINGNGSRDTGEPERVDEDPAADVNNDAASGIKGFDDNGDGTIDKLATDDDDEDGLIDEDPIDGVDNDDDGEIDEDPGGNQNGDSQPGIAGVDDDLDGVVDEGPSADDDEDGKPNEDWLDSVVFFLNGDQLMMRLPALNAVTGISVEDNILAEGVQQFQVTRISQAQNIKTRVKILLVMNTAHAGSVSQEVTAILGSGL